MKYIIGYLREYFKSENKIGYWIFIFFFLLFSLIFNYYFDFENTYLDSYFGTIWHYIFSSLLYFFAWSITTLAYIYWHKKNNLLTQPKFWLLALFANVILGCACAFHLYIEPIAINVPTELQFFARKCSINFARAVIYFVPAAIYWYVSERKSRPLYGFDNRIFSAKPYWLMVAIMLPLIIAASFLPDFQAAYPRYRDASAATYWGYPEWLIQAFFELFYGFNFIFLEFFFRGFFVMALARYMGNGAIIPMVTVYCYLHFGKPLGEAIGSIFGGFVLGVIALRSGSIWGGIIVHLGVAYLMEIFALLQKI